MDSSARGTERAEGANNWWMGGWVVGSWNDMIPRLQANLLGFTAIKIIQESGEAGL